MKPEKIAHVRACKCFEEVNRKVTGFTILILPHRLLCYNKPYAWWFIKMVIFSHRCLDNDGIDFKNFVLLAVYWSIWSITGTIQTLKLLTKNCIASTMLKSWNNKVPTSNTNVLIHTCEWHQSGTFWPQPMTWTATDLWPGEYCPVHRERRSHPAGAGSPGSWLLGPDRWRSSPVWERSWSRRSGLVGWWSTSHSS